jgi:DNA gyrase subunit A
MLNLKDMIHYFVEHRHDVLFAERNLNARQRAHIRRIDIAWIILMKLCVNQSIKNTEEARNKLIEDFSYRIFNHVLVEMRLRQLTGLGKKIKSRI